MRVILVEFSWQIKEIINNKESFKRDVIVSLNPESSYILKTNEISYFETYQICNHKELWSKYKELTNHTIKITKILDEALWNTDKRFKDYPNGNKNLWKRVLKDTNANEIIFVSDEYTVNDLLRISDLNILPWVSTTFFEALYFDSDIFVIDEDLFEKHFEGNLKDEIFYFNNANKFLLEIEKYLETGKFYTCAKKNSKNYYLKLDSLNKRDELLNDSLSKIN